MIWRLYLLYVNLLFPVGNALLLEKNDALQSVEEKSNKLTVNF